LQSQLGCIYDGKLYYVKRQNTEYSNYMYTIFAYDLSTGTSTNHSITYTLETPPYHEQDLILHPTAAGLAATVRINNGEQHILLLKLINGVLT
jgi:hypothetical protein